MRRTAALLASLLASACVATPPQPGAPLPLFPKFDREGDIRLTARLFGTLAVHGKCLVLTDREGRASLAPIWPSSARISRDHRGLVIIDEATGESIRPGDMVTGGGGRFGGGIAEANRLITPDLPTDCAPAAGEFYDFESVD